MSTHKHIDLICVAVLVCTLLLTVLFINGERLGLRPIVDGDAESSSDSAFFTRNDRDGSWSTAGASRITLSGAGATVAGGGAYVYDGNVVIAQAGRYVISGTLTDGSIIVSADSSAKVWILLDGADITCSDNACLRVEQAEKVFLTLADGTRNSMTSGAAYSEAALNDNPGGVIFSHDDLTINGSGSLTLKASYKHGIDVNDELTITGGTITIDAPQDGIHVNDGLNIEEVMDLSIADAYDFFDSPKIRKRLQSMLDVGLDYLSLGQPTATLSGGEVQRVKLASELHKKGQIYVLDEPSTGLHIQDKEKLLELLRKLVADGNTVVMVEQSMELIAQADWIIDLGPEGGSGGGKLVFQGTPAKIIDCEASKTGRFLRRVTE